MLRLPLLCLLLLSACALHGPANGLPERIDRLPWSDAPADRSVLGARALAERGETGQALELLATVLVREPRHVDANRLRQDILRQRGRRGLLLRETEDWLERSQDDALAWYLRGRIAFATGDKEECFRRAVELAPRSLWGWLGLAHTLRRSQPARAAAIFERLYDITDGHPVVAQAYVGMLLGSADRERFAAVCEGMQRDQRIPGTGALRRAQGLAGDDDQETAWRALLEAVRLRPFDPAAQRLCAAWLRASPSGDRSAELFDLLRQDPARLAAFGRDVGVQPLAELLERHRQPAAALELLTTSGVDARQPKLRQRQRRLLLALGDVAGFLILLRADVPRAIVAAEPNQLRGRWLRLLDGPWHQTDPLATPELAAGLLQAMLRTGLLVEVEQLAQLAAMRHPAVPAIGAARDEARAELAFEAGLRRLLYRGYRDDDHAALDVVAGRLRELSERVFGRDVVGKPEPFHLPLVGEMLDPFRGELSAHLAHYNRHLVLGRRSGGVAEGMLLTRLSLAELPADPRLPLPGQCFEVVAMDRDVRALTGVVGGDVAGIALLNHFLIDFDAVREWAGSIADRRAVVAADGGALLRDPLPARSGSDPLDVAWRLVALSPVQDADLELAVLDTIRHHERQHLVDSFHYFPLEWNLLRGLGLAFRFGLSSAAIQAEMERRAELASLAVSPHTELALAHIVDFLGDPGTESPHHRGFGALARQLEQGLRARGVAAAAAVPARWHLLDRELVRQVAQDLLSRLR